MRSSRLTVQRRKRQRGSAIVESTLCFLGFIFLTVGLMEFSMAVYAFNFVTWVASDAARYASLHGNHSSNPASVADIKAYVRGQAVALVSSRLTIEESPAFVWVPNNYPGSIVQIKVKYEVHPLVGMLMSGNMDVSSTSKMVIAN
jgi:hypothetical protein